MKVCVVQPHIIFWSKSENLKHIRSLIDSVETQIDLFVLPETFNTGFHPDAKLIGEEEEGGETLEWMKDIAIKKRCAITGSIAVRVGEGFKNRMYFVYPNGTYLYYDKKHLYTMGNEDDNYKSGSSRVIIEYNGWKFLLAICYDVRFPVFLRNKESDLYDVLIVVGCWSARNRTHWKTLTKARAIENQCFVLASNCWGVYGDARSSGESNDDLIFLGESRIYDPYGTAVCKGKESEDQCLCYILKKEEIEKRRMTFPVLKDEDQFRIIGVYRYIIPYINII
ncbi:hypothetical protein EIN_221710 [Entamoeba invadens IP1]|uniref:CN hydrolase domain-containing protein n=1 Tax=Entamoeba invadens IP1 TaxID=370355 RepID=A0A0A1U7W7_ENTIV|nr:hypothetical protein EIN_221710 [Entamoeba invadens IP1]ELP88048.1 hypothetical protein EIN_221710 [Entamoeba invadens IP1]|eukprot:XP_004254819.1 hypothetical protein EIN_221710 [Entamoeba invadens IP1]